MDLTVSLECRFMGTPDGRVWTQTQYPYAFWTRYLRVYDHVHVLARVEPVLAVPEDWTPWHMLASNGYEHYIRHIGQIVAIRKAVTG